MHHKLRRRLSASTLLSLRRRLLLAPLLVTVFAAVIIPASANANIAPGEYEVYPMAHNLERALDVAGASDANGTPVAHYFAHGGPNQRWKIEPICFFGCVYQLKPLHAPNKCLDVEGASRASGALAIIWDCHSGTNQKFFIDGDGAVKDIKPFGAGTNGLSLSTKGSSFLRQLSTNTLDSFDRRFYFLKVG